MTKEDKEVFETILEFAEAGKNDKEIADFAYHWAALFCDQRGAELTDLQCRRLAKAFDGYSEFA